MQITLINLRQRNASTDVLRLKSNNESEIMKNVIIFAILTAISTAAVAGHHKVAEGKHGGGHKISGLFEAAMVEMADIRRARFMAMDANGDGAVSREEAKTARKVRHEKSKSAVSGE